MFYLFGRIWEKDSRFGDLNFMYASSFEHSNFIMSKLKILRSLKSRRQIAEAVQVMKISPGNEEFENTINREMIWAEQLKGGQIHNFA